MLELLLIFNSQPMKVRSISFKQWTQVVILNVYATRSFKIQYLLRKIKNHCLKIHAYQMTAFYMVGCKFSYLLRKQENMRNKKLEVTFQGIINILMICVKEPCLVLKQHFFNGAGTTILHPTNPNIRLYLPLIWLDITALKKYSFSATWCEIKENEN